MGNYVCFFRVNEENGFLSNWQRVNMVIDGVNYTSVEQYMMYQKAVLFGDVEIADKILESSSPRTIKSLGRKVKNFDSKVWDANKVEIVKKGIRHKFNSNDVLLLKFLSFPVDSVFVEASPYDRIWGIGLGVNNPDSLNPSKWRGKNLLGQILSEVRKEYGE